jgi:hypothetical protein
MQPGCDRDAARRLPVFENLPETPSGITQKYTFSHCLPL